ncbi:MAG: hypothetical protein LC795_01475 [Acidobacteria bacterium]|nr:hypothetical protein [Acidobacteriota bacterium]
MRRLTLVLTACLTVLALTATALSVQGTRKTEDHTEWVEKILREMEQIKAGSTRAEFNKVFLREGGLSTGLQGTFAHRECPYVKVTVRFSAVGRPARDADGRVTLEESDADVVAEISRPYLDWAVVD